MSEAINVKNLLLIFCKKTPNILIYANHTMVLLGGFSSLPQDEK
jgi:hypothetical protein